MRTAAQVLGIVGGVFGIIFALIAMFVGSIGAALAEDGSGTLIGLGFVAILLAIAAIVGGALAKNHRTAAIILLLGPGVVGFIMISLAWILPGILLIVGGILEIFARDRQVVTIKP